MTKTSELASRAGVTVRTLRFYDRIGLLKARRTPAGHRVYDEADLVRLQQIRLLQFVGLSLEQIRALLREPRNLRQSLDLQLSVLREKQAQLARIVALLTEASQRDTDLAFVTHHIEREITMDWMKKFYDEETWEKVRQRAASHDSQQQAADQKRWHDLFQEAQQRQSEPLDSPPVQALAARFKALVDEFTGGDPKILQALQHMHASQTERPPGMPDYSETKAFLIQAMKAGQIRVSGA